MKLAILLAFGVMVEAQDNVIGLLKLPEVFGDDPCERFTPAEILLFATPNSGPAIGSIRVDKNWTFPAVGGCEGLTVNVHKAGERGGSPLPTKEHSYEAPAAIVLERRGTWFKLRLADATAWLNASKSAEYLSLESLLTSGLEYLTEGADKRLVPFPGVSGEASRTPIAKNATVRVVEFRWCSDRLWAHIEVLSHSFCGSSDVPRVTERGWIPAHDSSGEPAIWFPSRGC